MAQGDIYYYVNPTRADVWAQNPMVQEDPLVFTGPHAWKSAITTPHNGSRVTISGPSPSQGIYLGVPDTTPWPEPASYYQRITDLSTTGAQDSAAATVNETRNPQQIPIDELYRIKEEELANYRNEVRLSACALTGQANWALILDQEARDTMLSVDRFFLDRTGDALYDAVIDEGKVATDFPAYKTVLDGIVSRWPGTRQVNVAIRHKTLGTQKLSPVTNSQEWGQLAKDAGIFDIDISEAVYACSEDIDAAYDANGAGGWDALAAIDVTSAAYGWPAYWPKV